jgi:hypothetical protein
MSALAVVPGDGREEPPGLAARLRPEFATPIILVDPDNPVLGGPLCMVPACGRIAVHVGKCSAHRQRWIDAGRPQDVAAWAAAEPAARRWLQPPTACAIDSCRRAAKVKGLCHSHESRWMNAGRPELGAWIAGGGGGPALPGGPDCRFPECPLQAEGPDRLCVHHRNRWSRANRPEIEGWLLGCATFGADRFDLRALPTVMRLEIAYAIQCRADERRTITRPHSIRRLLRALPGAGAASLLDLGPEQWMDYLGFSSERGYIERRFLLDAIGYVRDVQEGSGWEAEFRAISGCCDAWGIPGATRSSASPASNRSGYGS